MVVAPVDDPEPAPVVGVDIDTDAGGCDDVRGRWMDTARACGIVMVSIGLVWLATCAVSYGWASVTLSFVHTVCFAGVDVGVRGIDRSRTVQWIVLAVATCIVKHVVGIFWRDGVAVIVSNVLRLVGIGAMHRRHVRGAASTSVFLLYGAGSLKILLYTYGYVKVGGVFYLLAFVAIMHYLNTHVLVADVAWSPVDLCFFGGTGFAFVVHNYITFISLGLNSMVLAVLMVVMQRFLIHAMVPFSKQWLGEQWRLAVVPIVLASELGPAYLLTRITTIGDLEFWGTVCIQEMNSLFKNLGWYELVVVSMREYLGRPVGATARAVSVERRSALAPCDNFAEVISVVFVAMMSAFQGARGIVLVGMSIALFIRFAFAVVESGIEACQTGHTSVNAMLDSVLMSTADPRVKTSLALLFAMQPVLLVLCAAYVPPADWASN